MRWVCCWFMRLRWLVGGMRTRAFSLLVDTDEICEVRLFLAKTHVLLSCLAGTGSENARMCSDCYKLMRFDGEG